MEDYIRQLSETDPTSMGFRYPLSKLGQSLLPGELTHINLRHLAEMMERLTAHLGGIDSATGHIEEIKADMEANMGGW